MSINWKQQRLDVFNRRVFVLVGGQLVLFSLLLGALVGVVGERHRRDRQDQSRLD